LEEFVARFHRPISLSIVRVTNQCGAIPQQLVDDLVQDTYLKLCANRCRLLLDFTIQHPDAVAGYVKTIAINVARDHFKSDHTKKRNSAGRITWRTQSGPSASLGGQDAMEREVLFKQ